MSAQPDFVDRPTSWKEARNAQFLGASDLKGHKVTFTIADVHRERVIANDKGGKKVALSVSFKRVNGKPITEKRWMLNDINRQCLAAMFGDAIEVCIGKRVTLMAVPFSSPMLPDVTEALRVWGSPDLPADLTFSLKQAFKKAKDVVMHKTVREAPQQGGVLAPQQESTKTPAQTPEPSPQPSEPVDWSATLRGCKSIADIDKAWADCKAALKEIPDPVDAAYQETRSALMEGDGEL